MNGKTIEESKAEYDASSLKQLMEANGHTICTRCYCCDSSWESTPCYQCGGFEDEEDEIWSVCSACEGEGEMFWEECLGRCDDNGHHNVKAVRVQPSADTVIVGRDLIAPTPEEKC